MKKMIFTLFFFFTINSLVIANPNLSEFNLRLYDNSEFTVVFGDMQFNRPQTGFTLAHVPPGNHRVRVFRHNHSFRGAPSSSREVFSGTINIQPAARIHSMIDMHGRYIITDVQPIAMSNVFYYQPHLALPQHNLPYWNHIVPMDGSTFAALKQSIERISFDNDKYRVAAQAAASKRMTSAQVKEVMMLFDFETNKLKFAKFAYEHVIDPEYYFQVNDAFTFSNSISSLNRHIMGF